MAAWTTSWPRRGKNKKARGLPPESEIRRIALAMLYELRYIINESEKDSYTKEEIMALLDPIAITKK